MGAPVATPRQTPSVGMMRNGAKTFITFGLDPDIEFEEVEVTPMGFKADDPIDDSTMHNVEFATKAPGYLINVTDVKATVHYSTTALPNIRAAMNRKDTFTVTHPDGATDAFYGILTEFQPGSNKWKEKPTASVTIVATNRDAACAEYGPVHAAASGTAPAC